MAEEISFEDFTKVDIRIGTIIEVNAFLKQKNLPINLRLILVT